MRVTYWVGVVCGFSLLVGCGDGASGPTRETDSNANNDDANDDDANDDDANDDDANDDDANDDDANDDDANDDTGSPARTAKSVASGDSHSCAVMSDGSVRCWGLVSGVPSNTTQSIDGLEGAAAITAGTFHTCALMKDSTVRCWGQGIAVAGFPAGSSVTEAIPDLEDVQKISAGRSHTCALLSDGTVRCWGDNSVGQVTGVKTTDCEGENYLNCFTPVTAVAGLAKIVELAAGSRHTCALDQSGNVWCWGSDSAGAVTDRLGELCPTGTEDECFEARVPTRMETIPKAIHIGAGDARSCAVLEDGTVRCWGQTEGGNANRGGSGRIIDGVVDARSVSTGGMNTCVILKDSSIRCWGAVNSHLPDRSNDEALAALTDVVQISAGGQHVCALSSDGTVRAWGLNVAMQVDGTVPPACTSLSSECVVPLTEVEF